MDSSPSFKALAPTCHSWLTWQYLASHRKKIFTLVFLAWTAFILRSKMLRSSSKTEKHIPKDSTTGYVQGKTQF